MRIVILDKKTVTLNDISLEEIEALGEVTAYDLTSPEQVAKRIGDAEIVLCNKAPITREVIASCENLKYIGLFATGYNNIDIEASKEYSVAVANAGSYSTNAVAQHVFALLLEFSSKVGIFSDSVKNGDWIKSQTFSYFNYPTNEISGLTIGILGFGSIGKAVAVIAAAFGMRVIVSTRTVPKDGLFPYEFVSQDEMFRQADIITIHCPLNTDTAGLICRENLNKMKKNAILINTSRGGVVNEQDLTDALNNEVIAGAGLDVISVEPMLADNPLINAKNCIITPHIAWAPKETRQRLISIVADNIRCFIAGNPKNIVN